MALQLGVVVDVAEVHHLPRHPGVAGERVLGERELQVAKRVEAGLDLGDDRRLVLGRDVDREPVGVEQAADLARHLQHDLVDVAGGVDPVRDGLQGLLEREPGVDVAGGGGMGAKHCAHSVTSCRMAVDTVAAPAGAHGETPLRPPLRPERQTRNLASARRPGNRAAPLLAAFFKRNNDPRACCRNPGAHPSRPPSGRVCKTRAGRNPPAAVSPRPPRRPAARPPGRTPGSRAARAETRPRSCGGRSGSRGRTPGSGRAP